MKDIIIKAINPDNDAEIRQLANLFKTVHGDAFPIRSVYDAQFLKTHIGSRFVSLGAFKGSRLIAHIALFPDRRSPKNVQLCYPLCMPNQRHRIPELGAGAWEVIQGQISRQNWQMLYYYVFGTLEELELLSVAMGMSETAICPGYFRVAGSETRMPLLIAQKMVQAEAGAIDVFLPREHQRIAELLYRPLGVKRNFRVGRTSDFAMPLPADRPAIERHYFRRAGICHAYVQPSLLSRESMRELAPKTGCCNTFYTFVNVQDSAAISVCNRLEDAGFRFCGVLPRLRGQDHVMYFHGMEEELVPCQFKLPRSTLLEEYFRHYDFDRAVAASGATAEGSGAWLMK